MKIIHRKSEGFALKTLTFLHGNKMFPGVSLCGKGKEFMIKAQRKSKEKRGSKVVRFGVLQADFSTCMGRR